MDRFEAIGIRPVSQEHAEKIHKEVYVKGIEGGLPAQELNPSN